MPGRVSTRPSTTSRISNKSSTQNFASRKSTASPAAVIPEETPTTTLRTQICSVFSDAQRTTASHRKLVVSLRKIQESCVYEPTRPGKKSQKEFDEDDFNVEIARCVIRVMGVKKSEAVGDRLVRFLGLFLRHANEKDAALVSQPDMDETDSIPETASTRLTSHILSILLQFLGSKEKVVRYRATQLVAHIINSLDSIDDDYYHLLRVGLLKRIRDKEPMVRVQAVLGLGRLAGNEDEDEQANDGGSDDDASGLLEKLLDVLQNDPSADVRRSLLLNLPLTPGTLPYLLERARDMDPPTRRALYSRLLPALGDFRHLSLSMREKLLRWGLRDRDENVRKATARLFRERWIEDCAGSRLIDGDVSQGAAAGPSIDSVLELLERIDIVNSGTEEGIGSEAMREFWDGRPDFQELLSLDDTFWDHLNPESIFVARSFNDYCRQQGSGKYESMVEDKLPEVTKLAFFLQKNTNILIEKLRRNFDRSEGEEEEDSAEQEFIVEQLLHMAKSLDYSDEVGRRTMFSLLRETLAFSELPEVITKLVVDVLRDICGDDAAAEREFCGVVLEAVAEVHDTVAAEEPLVDDEEESFHSAVSAQSSDTTPTKKRQPKLLSTDKMSIDEDDEVKAIKEIVINMKCLHIAQCMLQNVEGTLQQNVHLVTMLNNLVVPAVRSHEAPIRERGLVCLGLCCLLDKNLADENLTLFLHCFAKGHDALQLTAVQIFADILATHPSLLSSPEADENFKKSVNKMLTKGVKAQHTPEVQSAATIAACKLMLTSVINDEDILKKLVVCYFDPATKENAGVSQALSYFLPVYCHSRKENMERMAAIAASVMHSVVEMSEDLEEGEDMVGLNLVGTMLVDWTDARKLVVQDEAAVSWNEAGKEDQAPNGDIHLDLAVSLLERAMNNTCSKEIGEDKKAFITMLGKLCITANSSTEKLESAAVLVTEAIDDKIASEASSRNALNKLHLALNKAIGQAGKARKNHNDAVAQDDLTTMDDQEVDESKLASDPDVKRESTEANGVEGTNDSLLEELLSDDEDEDEDDDI
ncbi:chromosome condensation complex Condensin, subunit G [Lecanora helva]